MSTRHGTPAARPLRLMVVGGAVPSRQGTGAEQRARMAEVGRAIGRTVAERGPDAVRLVLCSPYENSADLAVARGLAEAAHTGTAAPAVELHYPQTPSVTEQVTRACQELTGITIERRWATPPESDGGGDDYLWLHSQLRAMRSSHAVLAMGGRRDGAAFLLLSLAEVEGRTVVPIHYLGGAGADSFARRQDRLEADVGDLSPLVDPTQAEAIVPLVERLHDGPRDRDPDRTPRTVFISYSRSQRSEADQVEVTLRRLGVFRTVFRDEAAIGMGDHLTAAIRSAIDDADVFLGLYSAQYATSPHCFDELDLALDRVERGDDLRIWLLRLDDTRLVPRRVREWQSDTHEYGIVTRHARTRDEIHQALTDEFLRTGSRT